MATKLVFFSFGILEQGGGFEYYLMSTTSDLRKRYKDLDISIVTMTPDIVEKLQHILTMYFMRKQDPKAIYRESTENVTKMLDGVPYKQAHSLKELAALLREADVIYSKNEILELSVLNKIGLKSLPPVVLGVHTPIYYPNTPSLSARLHNFLYTGLLYKRFIKRINRIQVNNADDEHFVRERLHFPKTKQIAQAFDIPSLDKKKESDGTLHLLFVGRLTEAKGIKLLLQVIEQLHKDTRVGNFTFTIAGSGDPDIVAQVKQTALGSNAVEYLGHVPNTEVAKLYEMADITIITSEYETLNKVAIETAIAGKIAICTDIPGPREVIKHAKTGFLLEPHAEDFVECIVALKELRANQPNSFSKIGESAYRYVKQKFNKKEVYEAFRTDILSAAEEGKA